MLLVDDHAMVRQGLRTMLERYADVEVVGEACNGEEALMSSEQLKPAVVVMDINMPKMNGIEATARLKARYPAHRRHRLIGQCWRGEPESDEEGWGHVTDHERGGRGPTIYRHTADGFSKRASTVTPNDASRCRFLGSEPMSLQQKIHFQAGLLSVEASGDFSLESAQQAFLEMLESVAQHKAEKILLDARNVEGQPEALERFFYGEFAARESRRIVDEHNIVPRFAYVMHHPLSDSKRLGETVALNRGMNVKVFETLKDAIEWLNTTC